MREAGVIHQEEERANSLPSENGLHTARKLAKTATAHSLDRVT